VKRRLAGRPDGGWPLWLHTEKVFARRSGGGQEAV